MKIVSGSVAPVVSYSITVGLQEQNEGGAVHSLNEVIDVIEAHLGACAKAGVLFFTGTVTQAAYVRAWGRVGMIKGPGACVEQVAVFAGDLDPLHVGLEVDLQEVKNYLSQMAALLAQNFGQLRVRVKFKDELWTVSA